jgi:ABC-type multidrug transport system fused ATPase/permease subunit
MGTDYTARLAKMMKMPEDALRAAGLSQEKVNDIFRRARAAKWKGLVAALLSLALYIGSVLLVDQGGRFVHSLAALMFLGSFALLFTLIFMTGPRKITEEATVAMQRRLVDLDRHCVS